MGRSILLLKVRHLKLVTVEQQLICPNCGRWEDTLNEYTGFCQRCSPNYCTKCGRVFTPDNSSRIICPACRRNNWFEKHADDLELLLAGDFTLPTAIEIIAFNNRPRCTACGDFIKMGRPGESFFCTNHPECIVAKRRYRTLKGRYQGNSELALLHVAIELKIKKVEIDE